MKIYDISMLISPDMPVYKNREDKRPVFRTVGDFTSGHSYETRLELDLHTGTHLDAPLHMIPGGKGIETLDLNRLFADCKVLDFTGVREKIGAEDLAEKDIQAGDFVLLKTDNSFDEQFNPEFVYLESGGAAYLKDKKIKGVGLDALGIERSQPQHDTHKILLSQGIVILEGIRLKEVGKGRYRLCVLPLKLSGVEAAPARAVLIPT